MLRHFGKGIEMNRVLAILSVALAVWTLPSYSQQGKNPVVTIETTLGTIVMELYPDKAPKTVENFVTLTKKGFYDGTLFHRVVPGFVIQGGDPLTKDPSQKAMWGSGGPGYSFPDEPVRGNYVRGAVAMANSGPNTNGSQFFICVDDLTGRLGKQYTLFGQVTKGMDVVEKIVSVDRDPHDCPTTNVVMTKVTVNEEPYEVTSSPDDITTSPDEVTLEGFGLSPKEIKRFMKMYPEGISGGFDNPYDCKGHAYVLDSYELMQLWTRCTGLYMSSSLNSFNIIYLSFGKHSAPSSFSDALVMGRGAITYQTAGTNWRPGSANTISSFRVLSFHEKTGQ
jgi:peptidyl-prolyl cis-trans isomerase B (cyclophilin B)